MLLTDILKQPLKKCPLKLNEQGYPAICPVAVHHEQRLYCVNDVHNIRPVSELEACPNQEKGLQGPLPATKEGPSVAPAGPAQCEGKTKSAPKKKRRWSL